MTSLPVIRTRDALRSVVAAWRADGRRVALVPTMGALHEGHLSLVRLARRHADVVVTSLFVNPTQFAPSEDFDAYPRDEAGDARLLAAAGCDALYAPGVAEIYPEGFATTVTVSGVTDSMEGRARPTHFAGVATVVAKLLIQCAPQVAVFGEKDYQQLMVIKALTRDLDLPVEIVGAPIVRSEDGLALSSRNAYLTAEQRQIAPALNRALLKAAARIAGGAAAAEAEAEGVEAVLKAGFDAVDYFETREVTTLTRLGPGSVRPPARLLATARLGATRLLDNVPV